VTCLIAGCDAPGVTGRPRHTSRDPQQKEMEMENQTIRLEDNGPDGGAAITVMGPHAWTYSRLANGQWAVAHIFDGQVTVMTDWGGVPAQYAYTIVRNHIRKLRRDAA
jgi:hypothetical protein